MPDDLIPISRYQKKLAQEIDDAEWTKDFERADMLLQEMEYVKREIDRGATYIPTF